MQRKLIAGFAILSLALVAYAGDPWKDKTYQQWDANDLQKIMFGSPWAQMVQVEVTWKLETASSDAHRAGSERAPTGGAGSYPQASSTGVENPSARAQGPMATFVVRWSSSLVERQAVARYAILNGRITEAEAEKALAEPQTDYQIFVAGQDMTPFQDANEDSLKKNTSLKMKKSKAKIAPTKVEIMRDPDGKKLVGILFTFPKKTESGEPSIIPDEKNVQFVCGAGKAAIRADFEPQHMATKQGQDL